jgi:hypothetical protein
LSYLIFDYLFSLIEVVVAAETRSAKKEVLLWFQTMSESALMVACAALSKKYKTLGKEGN